MAVRTLFNIVSEDMRTTTGANLRHLADILIDLGLVGYEGKVTEADMGRFNHLHEYVMTPESEQYRFSVLHDLLSLRTQYLYFEDDNITISDMNSMIDHVCSS